MATKKRPKPPKAFKAKITVTRKSGKVVVSRYNSRDTDTSLEVIADAFEEIKAGSKVLVEPSHVDDIAVDPDAYVEYLFQYTPAGPGEQILYKSIAAISEADARVNALVDEFWILIGTHTPEDTEYKTFLGALTV